MFAKMKLSDRRSAPSSRGSWDARPEPSWRRSGPKARVVETNGAGVTGLLTVGVFAIGFGLGTAVARAMGLI